MQQSLRTEQLTVLVVCAIEYRVSVSFVVCWNEWVKKCTRICNIQKEEEGRRSVLRWSVVELTTSNHLSWERF